MKIGELKDLINGIDPMLDDMKIHDGNEYLGAPEIDIELKIMDYLGNRYCDISVEVKGDTGRMREFTDIHAIATFIANGEKIRAIKEMRTQFKDSKGFPLSLRKSKTYIDRYLPMGCNDTVGFDFDKAAAKFVADHSTIFLNESDFKV